MPCMRYRDLLGFATEVESAPGVWTPYIEERPFSGDVVKYTSHFQEQQNSINPTPQLRNQISVVGTPFLFDNLPRLRYAWFLGYRWKITSTELVGNRLILDLGDLYTEDSPEEEEAEDDE